MTEHTINKQNWQDTYQPTLGVYENMFFLTVPDTDLDHIWSKIKRKGDLFLVPGIVYNAKGYVVTNKPYKGSEIVLWSN